MTGLISVIINLTCSWRALLYSGTSPTCCLLWSHFAALFYYQIVCEMSSERTRLVYMYNTRCAFLYLIIWICMNIWWVWVFPFNQKVTWYSLICSPCWLCRHGLKTQMYCISTERYCMYCRLAHMPVFNYSYMYMFLIDTPMHNLGIDMPVVGKN